MKLILQAIKALFRKVERGIYATLTALDERLSGEIGAAQTAADNAQSTADTANTAAKAAQTTANSAKTAASTAQTTANAAQTAANAAQTTANSAKSAASTAQTTADGKMNSRNPTGTGSFSLNRKEGSTIGALSYAAGYNVEASGYGSYAEGDRTVASGQGSHAEGSQTVSSGYGSHAEGYGTIAASDGQHVQGKYNVEDTEEKYAQIVGNGSAFNSRSNAHTLDWDGNAWFAGDVYIGGTGQNDPNAKTLVQAVIDALPIYNGEVEDV